MQITINVNDMTDIRQLARQKSLSENSLIEMAISEWVQRQKPVAKPKMEHPMRQAFGI